MLDMDYHQDHVCFIPLLILFAITKLRQFALNAIRDTSLMLLQMEIAPQSVPYAKVTT